MTRLKKISPSKFNVKAYTNKQPITISLTAADISHTIDYTMNINTPIPLMHTPNLGQLGLGLLCVE